MAVSSTNYLSSSIRRFVKLVQLIRNEVSVVFFYAVFAGFISLSLPLGIQAIINYLYAGFISTSLVVLIGLLILGIFISGWLQVKQMLLLEQVQRKVFTYISLEFTYRLPQIDLSAVDKYHLPELLNRFFDTVSIQKGVTKIFLDFPTALLQIFFGLLLLAFYHPFFIVFGLVLLGIIVVIFVATFSKGLRTSMEESEYKYELAFWLQEIANMVTTIKSLQKNNYHLHKTDRLLSHYIGARQAHFSLLLVQYWAFISFKILITAILLVMGAILFFQEQINLGQFVTAEIVIILLFNYIEKLTNSLDSFYDLLTSLEKVGKVLDKPLDSSGSLLFNAHKGMEVQLQGVSFRYGTEGDWILENISLHFKPQKWYALLGNIGAGKSTLLKMLIGSYRQFTGNILYNDLPLSNYRLDGLQSNIGTLFAESELFSGTLLDHLVVGNDSIAIEQVQQTLYTFGLRDCLHSLPKGLYTPILAGGGSLPLSIIHKLLLSRLVLLQPLLVLIEYQYLSAEDVLRLKQALPQATLVIASNDVAVAEWCDVSIVIENGKVVSISDK